MPPDSMNHRGLEMIEPEIETKTIRQRELVVKSDELKAELQQCRDDYGRAIAEGGDSDSHMQDRIRDLTEQQDAVSGASVIVADELVVLAKEKQVAIVSMAEVNMRKKSSRAFGLCQEMHSRLASFARDELLPLSDVFAIAIKEAYAAEREYDKLRCVPRVQGQGGVEKDVARPAQTLTTVAKILRAFVDGKPLPITSPIPSSQSAAIPAAIQ